MKQYNDLLGRVFTTYQNGISVRFVVLAVEPYPASRVKRQYSEILSIQLGMLVAVPHRGTLIPNITVDGGVARLTKVRVGERILDRPGDISKAIGITRAFHAITLFRE